MNTLTRQVELDPMLEKEPTVGIKPFGAPSSIIYSAQPGTRIDHRVVVHGIAMRFRQEEQRGVLQVGTFRQDKETDVPTRASALVLDNHSVFWLEQHEHDALMAALPKRSDSAITGRIYALTESVVLDMVAARLSDLADSVSNTAS